MLSNYLPEVKLEVLVAQLCPILCDPLDSKPPGSSVHGILQARILEYVAYPSPGDLPDPGIEQGLQHCRQIFFNHLWSTDKATDLYSHTQTPGPVFQPLHLPSWRILFKDFILTLPSYYTIWNLFLLSINKDIAWFSC